MQIEYPAAKIVFGVITNGSFSIPARSRGYGFSVLSGTATIGTTSGGTTSALPAGFSDWDGTQNIEDIVITATVGSVYYRYNPQAV